MNSNCFKTVFSKRHGALVAVGEHASSQGKANGAHAANGAGRAGDPSFGLAQIMRHFLGALTASFALVTMAWAQPALNALPTGGQVAQGAVQFSHSTQQLNIHQTSDRAAVNWQSFDIGAAAKVNVVQPSAQSVLLNRVGGTAPSQIFGQLSANGRVILVNPNGMVFGKDGSVSAAAFTGSTLNMSDADFMAGNERYTRGGAAGAIVNRGLIQAAPGGYVALLGASVSNEGRIVAPQGDVYLAAADAVTMPANAVALPIGQSGRIKLELSPASINAAVANQKGGTIVTEGGQVYLQAAAVNAALATIIQSGSIDTTGEQGGAVHVLADGGHIRVDGSIKANSTGTDDKGQKLAGGDIYIGRDKDTNVLAAVADVSGARLQSQGGFVETSGHTLRFVDTTVVAQDWLLDPANITIDNTNVGSIQTSLNAGTDVTMQTTGSAGDGQGDGNITVATDISKTGSDEATLTLKAHNNITVAANKSISSNSGKLNVVFHSDSDGNGEGGILMNGGSKIDSNGGNITFGGGAPTGATGAINNEYAQSVGGIGVNLSGTIIDAGAGNFTAKGKSGTAQGVLFSGTNTITAAQYTIDGQSTNGAAVYMGNGTTTFNSTGNGSASSIKGTSQTGRGVFIEGRPTLNFNANNGSTATFSSGKGEMRLGFGGGPTVNTNGNVTLGSDQSGFFSQANTTVNSGTLTLKGKSAGHGVAIQDGSGFATNILVKNGSSLVIDGESTGSGSGIHLLPVGVANEIKMTTDLPATIAGTITMKGHSDAGVGITTGSTPITSDGGNITLTGTSGGANGTGLNLGGVIRSGNATSGGKVILTGTANGTVSSVGINHTGTVQGGSVEMTGVAKGTNNAIFSTGTITATAGSATIKGTNVNTAANGGGGATLRGAVKAKNDVNLEGITMGGANQGLVIQNAVESTEGNINVTGESKSGSQRAVAIVNNGPVNASLKVSGTRAININANTLLLASPADTAAPSGVVTVLDAGTNGTVNIKTRNNNEIWIGGSANNDLPATTLAGQRLGIDQTELNRIKAGSLVIGDTASTGNITVAASATTLAQTGNVTLQAKGDITVNAALTVGDNPTTTSELEAAKNLTIIAGGNVTNGANGKIKATNLVVDATDNVGASNAFLRTDVVSASLKTGGNQFLQEDTALLVSAQTTANSAGHIHIKTENGTLTVGEVNGLAGVTARTGNITLEGRAIGQNGTKGLSVDKNVTSETGAITLIGDSKSTHGIAITGATVSSGGPISITGRTDKPTFFNTQTLLDTPADLGVIIWRGATIQANQGQAYADGANAISIHGGTIDGSVSAVGRNVVLNGEGVNMTTRIINNSNNGNTFISGQNSEIALDRGVEIANGQSAGQIKIFAANNAKITAAEGPPALAPATITQNSNKGVDIRTSKAGDLTVAKIINKGTGNVVIAAGSDLPAGDGGGGQVKTVSGNTISQDNATPGNTYIYSGSAASTDDLGKLDSTLGALKIDGTTAQNADTNAAFGTGAGINGSTAKAQAIFREKLTVAAGVLANTALVKNYGEASTKNPTVDANAGVNLLNEAKGALTTANSGDNSTFTTGVANSNNRIVVSKSAIVDTLTGTLTGGAFSTSNFLKADTTGTYKFAGMSSTKYDVGTGIDVTVNVNPLALSGSVSAVSTTYGTTAATGSASASGVLAGDNVSTSVSDAVLSGTQFSTSGSLRVGTYTQIASVTVTGPDAVNYTSGTASSFNYVVTPKQMTATATAADKVYDGNTSATLVASGVGILAGDVVTVQGLTGNFASKNVARDGSGNVVAQDVLITGTGSSLSGTDGANYTLVGSTSVPVASARITPKDLSLAGITAADKVYDGNTTAQLSSANAVLTGLVAGDSVNVSAQNAQGNFVDKNVARGANGQPVAKQVLVSGLALTGADQGNYQLGSSADVAATITPRTVSLSGSRALDKVVDTTTTAQVVPGTLEGLVAGEQLGVNASGEFEDALVGTNKLVNARFALVNGSNGLAGNYELANTTAALRASILTFLPGTVDAASGLPTGTQASRIRFTGTSSAGAATGVSDEPAGSELTEQCSVLNPQLCECEDTKIPGVEMCFAPSQVVSLKD